MNQFMRLERTLCQLRIYQHFEVPRGPYLAWINRITRHDVCGELVSERWLIRLPSWGFCYQINADEFAWSQRYVSWDSVTGHYFAGGIPVRD